MSKWGRVIGAAFTIVLVVFGAVMMFTGNIRYEFEDQSLHIDASYYEDLNIGYDEIESIEYRNEKVSGSRVNGWGSARLLMGEFKNDEFGYYTRYTYAGSKENIIIDNGQDTLVLSGRNAEETREIYETLLKKTGKQ